MLSDPPDPRSSAFDGFERTCDLMMGASDETSYAPQHKRRRNADRGSTETGCYRRLPKPKISKDQARSDHLIRAHHLAIEMPGRVSEHRQNYGKPEQQRYRAQQKRDRDEKAPHRHCHRILEHGSD